MRGFTITDTLIHKGGKLETYYIKDSWYIIEATDTEEEASDCHQKWLDHLNNMNHIEYLNYLKSCFVYCPLEV